MKLIRNKKLSTTMCSCPWRLCAATISYTGRCMQARKINQLQMELIISGDFSKKIAKEAILELPENSDYSIKIGECKNELEFLPEIDLTITGSTITGILILAFQVFSYVRSPSKYKSAKKKIVEILKPLEVNSFEIIEIARKVDT